MKNNLSKIITAVIVAVSVSFISLHLSQDNEYKKLLKLNKKALATEKYYTFGNGMYGKCSTISGFCEFTCPTCGFESGRLSSLGEPYDISGICIFCAYTPNK
jgi:hypothetical protein